MKPSIIGRIVGAIRVRRILSAKLASLGQRKVRPWETTDAARGRLLAAYLEQAAACTEDEPEEGPCG